MTALDEACVALAGRTLRSTRVGRLLILIYHRVRPRKDPMFPNEVDATQFAWQMRLLQAHCRPMSLSDAVPALRRRSIPPRAVAVTFDDGYADNAEVALPILRRFGIPATFFVAPGFLDGGRMWNDSIIEAIRRARAGELDLTDVGQGVVRLGAEPTRGAVAGAIIRAVKHLAPLERGHWADVLRQRVGVDLPDDLMMSAEQVRALSQAGMGIGAHTMSHPILHTISATEAREEIDRSRRVLEGLIRRPVDAFAYPNGRPGEDYTERDRNLVASLGFKYALSTQRGVAWSGSDEFQLPRFTPWDPTPARWLARLLLEYREPA